MRTLLIGTMAMAVVAVASAQPVLVGPNQKTKTITAAPSVLANFPQQCSGGPGAPLGNIYALDETRSFNGVTFVIHTTRYRHDNQVCVTTDLSDLQAKIPAIVNTAAVPTNNCQSYASPNPVVEIHNSVLASSGTSNTMDFTMTGKMTPWACGPGLPISHTEMVYPQWLPPYPRVWWTAGPDVKTAGIPVNFTESLAFTLTQSGNGVHAVRNANPTLPSFHPQVPQIDMSNLVRTALNSAHPTLSHPQAPLVNIEGQRYANNRSQIWGTF